MLANLPYNALKLTCTYNSHFLLFKFHGTSQSLMLIFVSSEGLN